MTDAHLVVMSANHDVRLVSFSILIAIIASYTALNLAGRVTVAQGRTRTFLWLAGGTIAMGVGIWSMHFIAMLAYNLPIPIAYNLPIVLVSMVVAVTASGVALFVVSRQQMAGLHLLAGGTFMGLSIAAMHYTGMAAMQLEAESHYNSKLVAVSIVLAIGASLIAMWLAFHLRSNTSISGSFWKLGSAIIMGIAIATMHYTGMAAVSFTSSPELVIEQFHPLNSFLLAVGIGMATLVILALALVTSLFEQRIRIETARAEALHQSRERFRSLVQNASNIIIVVASDRSVSYASPTIKPILGYEPETWNSAFEFVHPDDIAQAESLLTLALDCPSVNVTDEFRLRHADGQARDFEVIANNLLSESSVAGILTTYRDITKRKQAEVALRQQTERERLVTEIAQRIRQSLNLEEILQTTVAEVRQFLQAERVFIYRFEPDWSGVVVVESVLGWLPLLEMKVKDSFFEEASNRELYKQGRVQATEDIYTAGLSQCHINFLTLLQVRANLVVPILQEQQLWGLLVANHCSEPRHWQQFEINLLKQLATQVAIAIQQSTLFEQVQTELTERKRAEAEIKKLNEDLQRRAVELEAANKELEAFSYSVSHDLRAPLRAINGFSRILVNEYAPQIAPEAGRYLQMVRDNAQQMGCLVDDLLAFSRLSRSPLNKQLVASTDLVRQILADLEHEQENRQVEILLSELPTCHADPALLKQVWINLITNALKFTSLANVARIEVGCQQTHSAAIYFVKDNGVGFDMQYAHKLFGVFQRLHRAEDYEGTGVGLAIVQRVIHRHGGRVWAEAEINQGATFYFSLEEDIHNDRNCSGNSVGRGQPQRRGIDTALLEK